MTPAKVRSACPVPLPGWRSIVSLVVVATLSSVGSSAGADPKRPAHERAAAPQPSRTTDARGEQQLRRPARRNLALQVGGVALAVVGVGMMGTAVVFEVRAESKWSDIESAAERGGPWTPALQSTYDAARVDQLVGGLILAGGVAVALLGVLVYAQGTPAADVPSPKTSRWLDASQGRWRF